MEDKNRSKEQIEKVTNMVDVNPTISIITLNVNVPNASIKRET